jgi:hypothetical protein
MASSLYTGYGMSPGNYGSNPYAASPSAGYGGDAGGMAIGQAPATVHQQQSPGEGGSYNALDVIGVPNDGGRLSWPLALRILPPALEARELRERAEVLVQAAAIQWAGGRLNPSTAKEASHAVARLRSLLADRSPTLPISREACQEGSRFLDGLQSALESLK